MTFELSYKTKIYKTKIMRQMGIDFTEMHAFGK